MRIRSTSPIGSFRMEPGIFPGWHMNKAHWLTVALEADVEDEKIKFLVGMSYELTKKCGSDASSLFLFA